MARPQCDTPLVDKGPRLDQNYNTKFWSTKLKRLVGKKSAGVMYLCKGDFTGFSPLKDGSTWSDHIGTLVSCILHAEMQTNSPSFENFCRNQECSNRVSHTLPYPA